jgi:RNA:NAD 2'-phosphotransferase (TPT1/KptA family)
MEDVLLRHNAAIVHLDIDEVGVDSVDSRAENFKKHGEKVKRV